MFFLENADEMLSNQTETFSESINSVIEASYVFTEATLQSELEYKDIMMEAVVTEAEAERLALPAPGSSSDDTKKTGVMQNVANFFKKILEWVKKMFKKVKDFITKTVGRLFSASERAKRYVAKHAAEIKKVNKVTLNGLTMLNNKLIVSMGSHDAAGFALDQVGNNTQIEFVKSIKDQEVVVNGAVNFIKTADQDIKKLKSTGADLIKELKECEDSAKKGLKAAKENGDKSAINAARQNVSNKRRDIQKGNRMINTAVSTIARGLSDAFKVVKAAVKNAKSSN